MRVIVTGSRTWPVGSLVRWELDRLWLACGDGEGMVVVHGACPQGPDHVARRWCRAHRSEPRVVEAPFPADWERHGRRAGLLRSGRMVASGADLVLAFCHNGSAGTTGTIRFARAAGLPVRLWELTDEIGGR